MLTAHANPAARQRGAILVITMIALVAMTLASTALIRSVDTANIIAGNLEFQQAASLSAEAGIKAAFDWLERKRKEDGTLLYGLDQGALQNTGYSAVRQNPNSGQSWDGFWTSVLSTQSVTLPTDVTDNTASYAIQRLCNATGDPSTAGCDQPPSSTDLSGSSKGAGAPLPTAGGVQVYYRITVRIAGPRNTVNYVQAIIAM